MHKSKRRKPGRLTLAKCKRFKGKGKSIVNLTEEDVRMFKDKLLNGGLGAEIKTVH